MTSMSPCAYYQTFAPPPLTTMSGSASTSVPAVAPSAPAPAQLEMMNANLQSHVRVLEEEVRLLRQSVREPLGTHPTARATDQARPAPEDGAPEYYYTSAAAIAARRRTQLAALRERTQQLREKRGSRSATLTRSHSAPSSVRPQGRFVTPVEVVMVPTSSRQPTPQRAADRTQVEDDESPSRRYAETTAKPEVAFGRRVVPSARARVETARPSSVARRPSPSSTLAPTSSRPPRSAGIAGAGVPCQGEARGASIAPPEIRSDPWRVDLTTYDANRCTEELNANDGTFAAHHVDRVDALLARYSDDITGYKREHPYSTSARASPVPADCMGVVVPPLTTTTVPPRAAPAAGGTNDVQGAVPATSLEADVVLLARTVDVLRRTLSDRDQLLCRLAAELAGDSRGGSAAGSRITQLPSVPTTSPSTSAEEATVCVLAEEVRRTHASLLAAQEQLAVKAQQLTQCQLALTRRNEELAALLVAHTSSSALSSSAMTTDPAVPTTAETPSAPEGSAPVLPALTVPIPPPDSSTGSQAQAPTATRDTSADLPLRAPLHASTRTLDSTFGRPAAASAGAPTTTPTLATATTVNNNNRYPLTASPNKANMFAHTAWGSAVATPQLMPLSLPVAPLPASGEGMAQTLPPPTPAQDPARVTTAASLTIPPVQTVPETSTPATGTAPSTDAEGGLKAQLDAANRKLQAWERWFRKEAQRSQQHPPPQQQPEPSANTANGAGALASYYSAYTLTRRGETATTAAATEGTSLGHVTEACARCAALASAGPSVSGHGPGGAPPCAVRLTASDGADKGERAEPAVLRQSNWDLREDVRESIARERVLREIATRERVIAEERLAKMMQWRQEAESTMGTITPPPPPPQVSASKMEIVD